MAQCQQRGLSYLKLLTCMLRALFAVFNSYFYAKKCHEKQLLESIISQLGDCTAHVETVCCVSVGGCLNFSKDTLMHCLHRRLPFDIYPDLTSAWTGVTLYFSGGECTRSLGQISGKPWETTSDEYCLAASHSSHGTPYTGPSCFPMRQCQHPQARLW